MAGRSVGYLAVVVSVLIVFSLLTGASYAADRPPIKVGLLLPYTGSTQGETKGINDGVELYLSEIGQKAGGRAIEVIKEDDENNPTVGLTKLRRLVEFHKVNFVIGPVLSSVALAIHDYIGKQKAILIHPCAFTRELTSPARAKENVFRVIQTTDQANYPMAKWMVKNTPYRNVVGIAADFAAGHHTIEAFKAGFEEAGGKVIKEVFPKMGTMDFASYLSAIDVKGADAAYAFFSGTDSIRFVQQYQEFGLKKRLPLFGFVTIVDEQNLASIGDAALGVVSVSQYPLNLDTPANRAFTKAYQKKFNEAPSRYGEMGYVSANLIYAAAEALKGDIDDTARVIKEMRRVASQIDAPAGSLEFDEYNQRIVNMYVLKTEKREGKLVNVVIDRLGKIAQADAWKWWNK